MFPTDLEVEALVSSMDEDKSGQIELPELVQHMGLQVSIIVIIVIIIVIILIIVIPDLLLFFILIIPFNPDPTEEQIEPRERLCRCLQSL